MPTLSLFSDWAARGQIELPESPCAVAWNADCTRLVVGDLDGHLFEWSSTMHRIPTPPQPAAHASQGIYGFAAHPTGGALALGDDHGGVALWQLDPLASHWSAVAGTEWVEQLAFSPNGLFLAVASGRTLTIYETATGQPLLQAKRATGSITALAWRPDSKGIAMGGHGSIEVYRLQDKGALHFALPWQGPIITVAWSPTARYLAAGTLESKVRFWRLPYRPGEEMQMTGYDAKVDQITWDHSGRYLATNGGSSITIWDTAGKGPVGTEPACLDLHASRVSHLAFHPGLPLLASADVNGHLCIWQFPPQEVTLFETTLSDAPCLLNWQPGSHPALLVGSRDGRALWLQARC